MTLLLGSRALVNFIQPNPPDRCSWARLELPSIRHCGAWVTGREVVLWRAWLEMFLQIDPTTSHSRGEKGCHFIDF